MFNIKLINLHNNMFALANLFAMLSVITFASILSTLLASAILNKYKNLVPETPGLAISSHVTTNNALTIWIHD